MRMANFLPEHNRDEVQTFAYDEGIEQLEQPLETAQAFFDQLGIPEVDLPRPRRGTEFKFTLHNFVEGANMMAKSMKLKHFAKTHPLLVFKSTGNKTPRGHVTDTECRPDLVAAFAKDWGKNDTPPLWPCIRLAGERASKGRSRKKQEGQAISYLRYLLLARPDLHVAQGLLTSESGVKFLFGIGGVGIRSFTLPWEDEALYKLMYAFVHRLYEPGDFVDPSYVKVVPNLNDGFVTYTVRIPVTQKTVVNGVEQEVEDSIECHGFQPIYASSPFATRTHILSNPQSKVMVNGKALTVFKDQLCRLGTRFNEHSILTHIHNRETVPGVVEEVYHELIKSPRILGSDKVKRRLGLRQSGRSFSSIRTLQKILETVFDTLEVLRYLRFKCQVLHRDISKGNILYIENETLPTSSPIPIAEEASLCFVKHLLGDSDDPRETSVLLIDFNHAEHLASNQEPHHKRTSRTGTPVFIARAVEMRGAVPFPDGGSLLYPTPESPAIYSQKHPDRIKKFPPQPIAFQVSAHGGNQKWRHELDHDAESVYWLLVYWAMTAQPTQRPREDIEHTMWSILTETAATRGALVGGLSRGEWKLMHSFYAPLHSLIVDLARILAVDRHWLEESNPRNDPAYVGEAFQRLILKFILSNRNKAFMVHQTEIEFRKVKRIPAAPGMSETKSEAKNVGEE